MTRVDRHPRCMVELGDSPGAGLAWVMLLVWTRAAPIPRGAVPRAMVAAWGLVLLTILSTMGAPHLAHRPANVIGWSFIAAAAPLQAFAPISPATVC